jgi:flagellar biosynthesis regulator FlaF
VTAAVNESEKGEEQVTSEGEAHMDERERYMDLLERCKAARERGERPTVSDDEFHLLLAYSDSQKAVAACLGVVESAISNRKKRLEAAVSRSVSLFSANRILERQLSTAEQLDSIGRQARLLLELVHTVLEGETQEAYSARAKLLRLAGGRSDLLTACVKLQGELRKQLELDFSMKAKIYDLKQVQEFQAVVLEEIGKAAPEVQKRITERLVEVNAARSALDFGTGAQE